MVIPIKKQLLVRLEDNERVITQIIMPLLRPGSILLLKGPLGAGKTTLTKRVLALLGVSQPITSPTFGYVNRYACKDDLVVNHFDLYRIQSLEDFLILGFDEYLNNQENISIIEWPEVIQPLLMQGAIASRCIVIALSYLDNDQSVRMMSISYLPR